MYRPYDLIHWWSRSRSLTFSAGVWPSPIWPNVWTRDPRPLNRKKIFDFNFLFITYKRISLLSVPQTEFYLIFRAFPEYEFCGCNVTLKRSFYCAMKSFNMFTLPLWRILAVPLYHCHSAISTITRTFSILLDWVAYSRVW